MFSSFMTNAWISGTLVAIIAGVVGFFIVLRGQSFLAHAVPHGAFAGAAGAVLLGINPLVGLAVFATVGAVSVSVLSRRARNDVVTALTLVMMLALGDFFLSRSNQYSAEVFGLLFGQILGVAPVQLIPMVILGMFCLALVLIFYRPLLLSSVLSEMAPARGVSSQAMSVLFALVVAAATTMSVTVVGALLMFALLIGPPAAARAVTRSPGNAIVVSLVLTLLTVWSSIALSYQTNWPVGFFVTVVSTVLYVAARGTRILWGSLR